MEWQLPTWLKTVLPFFHPAIMWVLFGLALYALYLGIQVRRMRSLKGEQKKQLIQQRPAQKHYQIGSIFLALIVVGTVGGMAVTYITNGKLFVGPHLLAGLGMMSLVAISAALAPLMQQGQQWARTVHIVANVAVLGIFGWQAVTGVQIVQKIVTKMLEASAVG